MAEEEQERLTYAIPIDAFFIRVGPTQETGDNSLDTLDTIKIVQVAENIIKSDIRNTDWGDDVDVELVSLDGGVSQMTFDDGFSEWAVGGGIVAFDAYSLEDVPSVDELQAVVEASLVTKLLLALQDTPYSFLTEMQYSLVTENNVPNIKTQPPSTSPPNEPPPPTLPNEPTPSPNDEPNQVKGTNNSRNNSNIGAVVGSTVGAVVFLLVFFGFILWRRRKIRESQQGAFPDKNTEDLPGVYIEPLVTLDASFPETLSEGRGEPSPQRSLESQHSISEPYDGQILVLPPAVAQSPPPDGTDSVSVEVFEDPSVDDTDNTGEEEIIAISRKSSGIEALAEV